ncbi:MAG: cystathionine beta-lyase [Candidatus Binataceae bacterium]
MKDESIAVVAGRHPHSHYGVVNTPVFRASTILFETFEQFDAAAHDPANFHFAYGRLGTPTSASLEDAMVQLEGGAHCRLAPSGLAAITTALMAFLSAGDHLLMTQGAYPPARRFCDTVLKKFGVETTFYDPVIDADIAQLIRPNTKIIYVESPSSGLIEIQDVPAIAGAAHARGAVVMMDNTWATPLFFKPFEHGVDVSIQAATKYIVGHSDAMLGTITCTEDMWTALRNTHRDLGQMSGADDIYLALRGLRTMAVRLAAHYRNGLALARFLEQRPEVRKVFHPALASDPGHALWQRDFTGASGLFSFTLRSDIGKRALAAMMDGLKFFGMGYSWGGFESLAAPFKLSRYRAEMGNAAGDEARWGVRIHAGLENPDDLIADLEAGFARLTAAE